MSCDTTSLRASGLRQSFVSTMVNSPSEFAKRTSTGPAPDSISRATAIDPLNAGSSSSKGMSSGCAKEQLLHPAFVVKVVGEFYSMQWNYIAILNEQWSGELALVHDKILCH